MEPPGAKITISWVDCKKVIFSMNAWITVFSNYISWIIIIKSKYFFVWMKSSQNADIADDFKNAHRVLYSFSVELKFLKVQNYRKMQLKTLRKCRSIRIIDTRISNLGFNFIFRQFFQIQMWKKKRKNLKRKSQTVILLSEKEIFYFSFLFLDQVIRKWKYLHEKD